MPTVLQATVERCRACGERYTPLDDAGVCGRCQHEAERCQCGRVLTVAERECGQGCCDACMVVCPVCLLRLPVWELDTDGFEVCRECAREGF